MNADFSVSWRFHCGCTVILDHGNTGTIWQWQADTPEVWLEKYPLKIGTCGSKEKPKVRTKKKKSYGNSSTVTC